MARFDDFTELLKEELKVFAKKEFKAHKDIVIKHGKLFFKKNKTDLKRWTKRLKKGQITQEDFTWLVESHRDLLELQKLEQAGLAKVAAEECINGLLKLVSKTAFKVFI